MVPCSPMAARTPNLSGCNPPPILYIDRGRVAVLVYRGGGAHTSSIQFSNPPKIIPHPIQSNKNIATIHTQAELLRVFHAKIYPHTKMRQQKASARQGGGQGFSLAFQECAILAWQYSNSDCQIQSRRLLRARQYVQTNCLSNRKAL
jgi:hypothetical protein